jgi:hypothetical protein
VWVNGPAGIHETVSVYANAEDISEDMIGGHYGPFKVHGAPAPKECSADKRTINHLRDVSEQQQQSIARLRRQRDLEKLKNTAHGNAYDELHEHWMDMIAERDSARADIGKLGEELLEMTKSRDEARELLRKAEDGSMFHDCCDHDSARADIGRLESASKWDEERHQRNVQIAYDVTERCNEAIERAETAEAECERLREAGATLAQETERWRKENTDRPQWSGPDDDRRAEWRGLELFCRKCSDTPDDDPLYAWRMKARDFTVRMGTTDRPESGEHCAEGAARDYQQKEGEHGSRHTADMRDGVPSGNGDPGNHTDQAVPGCAGDGDGGCVPGPSEVTALLERAGDINLGEHSPNIDGIRQWCNTVEAIIEAQQRQIDALTTRVNPDCRCEGCTYDLEKREGCECLRCNHDPSDGGNCTYGDECPKGHF